MIKTKMSIVIRRPVADVFQFVTTLENFPRWSGDLIQESHQTSPGPVGVGTTFVQQNQFLGRHFETPFEVVAYEPDARFCVQSQARFFAFGGCYLFDAEDGGTRLTSAAEVEVAGFFALAGSVLISRIRRQTEIGLANLKALLETETAAAP